jgi:tetratricopeptide (TPR) repeat protein
MDLNSIFHYIIDHGIFLSFLLVAAAVIWVFVHNEDVAEHRSAFVLCLGFLIAVPLFGWLVFAATHSKPAATMLVLIGLTFGFRILLGITQHATNDFLGGFIYDALFSEGAFAELVRPVKKLPNLRLLHHWRDTGSAKKAYRLALRGLANRQEAFPVWMFAAETAAVHLSKWRTAIRIIQRLQRSSAFTESEKTFASSHLRGLAATQGYQLDLQALRLNHRSASRPKPLVQVTRLRKQGQFAKAKALLQTMLQADPDNLAAGVMLVRVYVQDLHRRDKAEQIIDVLERRPFTPHSVIDFLRNSLDEWAAFPTATIATPRPSPAKSRKLARPARSSKFVLEAPPIFHTVASAPQPEVQGCPVAPAPRPAFTEGLSPRTALLVEERRLGTAVEELERLIQAQPRNLETLLELAQVHIINCGQLKTGEQIVNKIERDPEVSDVDKATVREKLKRWRQKYTEENPFRFC